MKDSKNVTSEEQDVIRALAQGGNSEVDHVQTVVEVLAEAPGLDLVGQIAVRRGHDPHIDPGSAWCRQPGVNWRSWTKRSSFAWTSKGSSPISSREDSAPPGLRQPSGRLRLGAGVGTALVAEELALQQAGRHGSAIDDDERLRAPVADLVNGLREEFLAGAALARHQDRGVGCRRPASPF